jgi:hypothetical protein
MKPIKKVKSKLSIIFSVFFENDVEGSFQSIIPSYRQISEFHLDNWIESKCKLDWRFESLALLKLYNRIVDEDDDI